MYKQFDVGLLKYIKRETKLVVSVKIFQVTLQVYLKSINFISQEALQEPSFTFLRENRISR